jgi:hypothetical protein
LEAVRRTGKHAEGTICYTVSPLHTVDKFVEMAQRLRELGCNSICIKDMAALLRPQPACDLVRGIKERCGADTIVHVHVHSTTGVTMVSLMKAIEAGADIVDSSISSLSLGPGHNPTEALVEMLEGTGFTTRLDKDRLRKIKEHFAKVRPRYTEFESKFVGVETDIFDSQIPGGMISNMESQLKQQGATLVLFPGNTRLSELLFLPRRNPSAETWTGHMYSPEEAAQRSGIREIWDAREFEPFMKAIGSHQAYQPNQANILMSAVAGSTAIDLGSLGSTTRYSPSTILESFRDLRMGARSRIRHRK